MGKRNLSVLLTSVFLTLAFSTAASAVVVTVPYDGDHQERYERREVDYKHKGNYNSNNKKVIIQKNNHHTKKVIIIEKDNHRNNRYKKNHNHKHIEHQRRNTQPGVEIKINLPIKRPNYY